MKNRNIKNIFIWSIFVFSAIVLIVNFAFLEFWYAQKNDGFQNGFHIWNTEYSIFHWSMKISYISCSMVVLWSGLEVASIYNIKFKPSFTFRYVITFWIISTMVGESYILPEAMAPRVDSMLDAIFNDGPWLGSYGFIFSFLDFFQFVSIHITIPIMVLTYIIIYRDVELADNEYIKVFIVMNLSMLAWIGWSYLCTALGVERPYPVIDATPNGESFKIIYQVIILSFGIILQNALSYLFLNLSIKFDWNNTYTKN